MAQFDVYANTNKKSQDTFPFIVDVQNPLINGLTTRLVIPMTKTDNLRNLALGKLTPSIAYNKQNYLLLSPQLTSLPSELLKNPIGTIKEHRDAIVSAIDFAITGI
jgi:toxin CcdB